MPKVCHFKNKHKTAAIVGLLDCSSLKSEVKERDSSGGGKKEVGNGSQIEGEAVSASRWGCGVELCWERKRPNRPAFISALSEASAEASIPKTLR